MTAKGKSRNSLKLKKAKNGTLVLDGHFEYRSLECKLTGSWDGTSGATQGLRMILRSRGRLIMDQVMTVGADSLASHCKFGGGVTGIKELQMLVERSRNAHFVSGAADGCTLITNRYEDLPCCTSDIGDDPALSRINNGKLASVEYALRDKRVAAEMEGLGNVIETTLTAYRASRGSIIDDIIDIAIGAYCYIKCSIQFLICLARGSYQVCQRIFIFCVAACQVVSRPLPLPFREA